MWFSQIVKVMHNTSRPLSLLKLTVKFNWSVYLRQVPQQEPDGDKSESDETDTRVRMRRE